MKRTIAFILIISFVLVINCGCESSEKTQLEQSGFYEVAITDDYNVTLEVISQTQDYFEVEVSKEKTDGYFASDPYNFDESDATVYDLAIVDTNTVFEYVLVNDEVKIDGKSLGGGIVYGCPWTFYVNSFEGSVNLKFYFYHAQTHDYTVKMFTRKVLDLGIIKVGSVKTDEGVYNQGDSIIHAIALDVEKPSN